MGDLPPAVLHGEVPRSCVLATAQAYQLPVTLIGGVLFVEGGRLGMAKRNDNGSVDYGPAQVNSAWLTRTRPAGVSEQELRHNSCANIWVAGWILKRCLDKFTPSFWRGVGCYHAGENARSPKQIERMNSYAAKVHKAIANHGAAFSRWVAREN